MNDPLRHRPRRLRRTESLRSLARETRLHPEDLILPLFVVPGDGVREPVPSMPGVERVSVDELPREGAKALKAGVRTVLLFGIPASKDERGSEAWAKDGIVQRAVAELRSECPELTVVTDLCLCEYTSHGHCGVLDGDEVLNDATLPLLARAAVSQARAGAHLVAPSDMMDGRVGAVREALDEEGFHHVGILSYAAKYASAFYGPFRDAAESSPERGDRRGYQMDPANVREALREVRLDVEEGADVVMVKPGLPYMDVVSRVSQAVDVPVAAYHVSGEYSALMAAHERGWLDADAALLEAILSLRRAGAQQVVTYGAVRLALALQP